MTFLPKRVKIKNMKIGKDSGPYGWNRDDTMTNAQTRLLFQQLEMVFDIVRLVDVSQNKQFYFNSDGSLEAEPYRCFTVWRKNQRCENCISAKAFIKKSRMTKFEFVDDEIYHVTAMYIEVENKPYVLEIVSKITDEALFGAYGKNEFSETISRYNQKLYKDPLTGVYNRRYFDDQLSGLTEYFAVAMLDVDNFKIINDTYGHQAGDDALRAIVDTVSSQIRETDAFIRYGGDEFVIIFQNMSKFAFSEKLEDIRKTVNKIVLEKHPSISLSVSIGGSFSSGRTVDSLEKADKMLYEAKRDKNTIKIN